MFNLMFNLQYERQQGKISEGGGNGKKQDRKITLLNLPLPLHPLPTPMVGYAIFWTNPSLVA